MDNNQILEDAGQEIGAKAMGLPKGSAPIGPFIEILIATLIPMLTNCFGNFGASGATERVKRLGLFQRAALRRRLWDAYGNREQGNAATDATLDFLRDNSDERIDQVISAAFNVSNSDDTGLF